jgi:hypothetical protein
VPASFHEIPERRPQTVSMNLGESIDVIATI